MRSIEAMDRTPCCCSATSRWTQAQQVAFATQFGPLNPGLKQIGRQHERMAETR